MEILSIKQGVNEGIEKEVLICLLNEKKFEGVSEDEFITENAKKFLRLMKKFRGNQTEILGAVVGSEIEDYAIDIVSAIYTHNDLKNLMKDLREEKRIWTIQDIKQKALNETDTNKIKELLSNIPEYPEEEVEEDFKEVVEDVVLSIIGEGKPIKKISTGFQKLDNYLDGGFYPGTLNIVAGRPGTGKSAFSLSMFNNQVLKNGYNGVYFSLEMGRREVLQRIFSNQSGIDFSQIRGGRGVEDMGAIGNVVENIEKSKIDIIDNLFKFNNICQKIKDLSKNGLEIVYIDYLGLMEIKGNSKYEQISLMTRKLKELSRECEIPIILLSQLNRNDSNRGDRTPQLSDLRDSGSIEQDADSVIMLYKPDEDMSEIDLWIRKNRNGPSDVCIEMDSKYRCMQIVEK